MMINKGARDLPEDISDSLNFHSHIFINYYNFIIILCIKNWWPLITPNARGISAWYSYRPLFLVERSKTNFSLYHSWTYLTNNSLVHLEICILIKNCILFLPSRYDLLSYRECQYLEYLRRKNLSVYSKLLKKLREDRFLGGNNAALEGKPPSNGYIPSHHHSTNPYKDSQMLLQETIMKS